jgi:2-dehydro-3-deoxygluconokinase
MKIACIGEAMVELSLAHDNNLAQVNFAGDTLNTAVYLKRSLDEISGDQPAHDNHVAYITVLGTDSLSDQIITTIQSEGIDTQYIARTQERVPGLYAINTDALGERSFTYWRERSAARLLFSESTGPALKDLEQFDLLYYSAITLAILPIQIKDQFLSFLESFRQLPGKQVAFDSNYRPKLWVSNAEAMHYTQRAWQQCDIALPSLDDEMALFGDNSEIAVIERLGRYGFENGALKRGAQGPLGLGGKTNGENASHPYVQIDMVVDSTAAGDSFNGGYLASIINNQSPVEALITGHHCASRVIQFPGAIVDKALWEK